MNGDGRAALWGLRTRAPILGLGLGLCAGIAQGAAGWTGYGRVLELNANQFGRFAVRLDVGDNPTSCRDKEWYFRDSILGSDLMYRALLEALRSDLRVRVYVTGVCGLTQHSEISDVGLAR